MKKKPIERRSEVKRPIILFDASKIGIFPEAEESKEFKIFKDEVIGRGISAQVVKACKAADCAFAAKLLHIETPKTERNDACFSPLEAVLQELTITKMMSDLGVAPKLVDAYVGDKMAVIIMERYAGTLSLLWPSLTTKEAQAVVLADIIKLVLMMHKAGVLHTDLWAENIVFRRQADGSLKFAIIDYGKAVFSTDPSQFDRDYEFLYWDLHDIGFHNVQFVRDNVECSRWWP